MAFEHVTAWFTLEYLSKSFLSKLIVAGAVAYVSTKQAQRKTKEVWTATGTVVEGIHYLPIGNLCIATNMKYERGRGVGKNVLDKTTRKEYRGGTGTPQGY